jgi:hypothetical protein
MKIDFEYETQYGKFGDALWFPDGEPLPSPEEIKAMELERLNNWIAFITAPPPPDPPEPEPGPTEVQPA